MQVLVSTSQSSSHRSAPPTTTFRHRRPRGNGLGSAQARRPSRPCAWRPRSPSHPRVEPCFLLVVRSFGMDSPFFRFLQGKPGSRIAPATSGDHFRNATGVWRWTRAQPLFQREMHDRGTCSIEKATGKARKVRPDAPRTPPRPTSRVVGTGSGGESHSALATSSPVMRAIRGLRRWGKSRTTSTPPAGREHP